MGVQLASGPLLEAPPQEGLPSIELPTPHHYRLVRQAIEDRADTVKGLAKKLDDEGYLREARVLTQDAAALTEGVLPQFERQAEIPLATADELSSAIVNELRGLVRKHVRQDDEKRDHEAELLKSLGDRVTRYTLDVSTRSYAAGMAAREAIPEVFGLKAIEALRS